MCRRFKCPLEACFGLEVCIDCFSAASDLNLRDPAVCQQMSQTFLCVDVIFPIFIGRKSGSGEKFPLLQAMVCCPSTALVT